MADYPTARRAGGVKRFRCRCGSANVRLIAVPIFKRPKPVPPRPAALRPIYREAARTLKYRGPSAFADAEAVERALDVLRAVLAARRAHPASDPVLAAALTILSPHVYRISELVEFVRAIESGPDPLLKMQAAHHAFTGILRQLGRPNE